MRFHVCDPEKSSQNLRLRWPGLSPIPRLERGEKRGRRMRRATRSLIWRLARTNRWECCRQSWQWEDELQTMDGDQELEKKKRFKCTIIASMHVTFKGKKLLSTKHRRWLALCLLFILKLTFNILVSVLTLSPNDNNKHSDPTSHGHALRLDGSHWCLFQFLT